jgi:3-oxoacyl-[acyl-carrier protein] reductase
MRLLEGKKAVITGGSRGIGKAIAKSFLENGAEVLLVARSKDELTAVAEEFQSLGVVTVLDGDVSDQKFAALLEGKIASLWGGFDVLVNAAGLYGPIGLVTEVDPSEWQHALNVNLFGTFLMINVLAPLMQGRGRGVIINFVGGGEGAYAHFSSYVAAKGGIIRLNETVAAELQPLGIEVNAIAPGAVNTKFLDDIFAAGPEKAGKEAYEKSLKQKESGGVTPEKAANVAVFLASEKAKGLTGKVISAVWDPYEKFSDHLQDIMTSDVYAFRRIRPKDRGFTWEDQ